VQRGSYNRFVRCAGYAKLNLAAHFAQAWLRKSAAMSFGEHVVRLFRCI